MNRNVGNVDRGARGLVGIFLFLYFLSNPQADPLFYWGSLVLGIVMIGTAVIGWCPPYTIFGINTCATKEEAPSEG